MIVSIHRSLLPALLVVGIVAAASAGFTAYAYHWSWVAKGLCGLSLGIFAGWLGGMAAYRK